MNNSKVVLRTYKNLLKELKQGAPSSFGQGNSSSLTFLRSQFRNPPKSLTLQQNLERANEYLFALQSVHKQKALFVKYGVGSFVDEREKLKKISHRVGLELPEFFQQKDERIQKELSNHQNNENQQK